MLLVHVSCIGFRVGIEMEGEIFDNLLSVEGGGGGLEVSNH